jgi:hypothetical protein
MFKAGRILVLLVLFFGVTLVNAQMPAGDNNGQAPQQPAVAPGEASSVVEKKPAPISSLEATSPVAAVATDRDEKIAGQEVLPPKALFDERYTLLRQGRDQEVAVLLCPLRDDCRFQDKGDRSQPIPISLRIESMEGFTIRYGYPRHYKSASQGTPAYHADHRLIFLKVHAGTKVTVGKYTLKGTMVYRRAGDDVSAEPQTTIILIPVTVASHDDTIMQNDWPYIHHPGRALDEALQIAALVPLLPVLGVACLITVHSLDCH